MKIKNFILLISVMIFLSGCTVFRDVTSAMNEPYQIGKLVERYEGNIPDNNDPFFETYLKFKEGIKGNKWFELSSPLYYFYKGTMYNYGILNSGIIKGTITTDQSSDIHLTIQSIKYIATWPNGWTSGENEASGEIILHKDNNAWKANVKEDFAIWDVIRGGISSNLADKQYTVYDEGLRLVKNRMDRIESVVDFLKKQKYIKLPEYFYEPNRDRGNIESFKKQTQFFLFPETLGIERLYKQKKLPEKYVLPDKIKDDISIGDGVAWRKSYTKAIFPENMVEVRNAGGLWSDYEEANQIFIMLYNLDYYFKNVLPNTEFKKIN